MKRAVLICLLFAGIITNIQAFQTQEELDLYLLANPNPIEYQGTLSISGSVNDLRGLASLRKIEGSLIINYTSSLKSAQALDSLNSISEDIIIAYNDVLEKLPNFSEIRGSIRSLVIAHNSNLLNFPTFLKLYEIRNGVEISNLSLIKTINFLGSIDRIGGDLLFFDCQKLESIIIPDTFAFGGKSLRIILNPNLRSIHGCDVEQNGPISIVLRQNHSLDTINAFNGFNGTDSHIRISDNGPMRSITAFNEVRSLSSITLNDNKYLLNFSSFQNLEVVDGIEIYNNSSLIKVSGFENLYSVRHLLNMYNNVSLINIEGFENITWYGDVRISMNPMLSDCAIRSICRHLSFESSTYVLAENNDGCNSKLEILNSCMTSAENTSSVVNHIHITQQAINFNKSYPIQYQIFFVDGVLVESGNRAQSVSIIDYLPGVYFLKLPEYSHSQLFIKN